MNIDSSVTKSVVEFSNFSDNVLQKYIEAGEHRYVIKFAFKNNFSAKNFKINKI